jgi:chromosome segregation ATPase
VTTPLTIGEKMVMVAQALKKASQSAPKEPDKTGAMCRTCPDSQKVCTVDTWKRCKEQFKEPDRMPIWTRAEIESLKAEIDALTKKVGILETAYSDLSNVRDELEQKVQDLEDIKFILEADKKARTKEIKDLEAELKKKDGQLAMRNHRIEVLKEDMKLCKAEIRIKDKSFKEHYRQIHMLLQKIKKYETKLTKIKKEYAKKSQGHDYYILDSLEEKNK